MSLVRKSVATVALLMSANGVADIPVPPAIDVEIVSETEGYHFYIDNDLPEGFLANEASNYYPTIKAIIDVFAIDRTGAWAIGNPQGYDHGYELLGFIEPDFNGNPRNVNYWNCEPDGCDNGFATAGQILMPAPLYRTRSHSCTRMVLGHELFHHIQFAYRAAGAHDFDVWALEGMARAMQDKIYSDLDLDPDASCVAPYLNSVGAYLQGNAQTPPNQELPIWETGYDAALWWTYLMEQFGTATDEPIYGADFIRVWYEHAVQAGESGNSVSTTNSTIQSFVPGTDILAVFRRFALANVLKDMDLSQQSAGFRKAYSYVDEQSNGPINQDQYAEVRFTSDLSVSEQQPSDTGFFFVREYATQYHDISLAACPSGSIIRVTYTPSPAGLLGQAQFDLLGAWGLVVGQSTDGDTRLQSLRPARFYKKLDEQWSVSVVQPDNPYERAIATTSGVVGPIFGEIRVDCEPQPPTPLAPELPLLNPLNPMTPGPTPTFTAGEVCAVPSIPTPGLDPSDYRVAVDDTPVRVLAAAPRGDGHCLQIDIPPAEPGTVRQDLSVTLAGQTTTVVDAIVRHAPAPNVLVAVDTSTSMLSPADASKLRETQLQLTNFVDLLLPLDDAAALPKIGLIEFADSASVATSLLLADQTGLGRFNVALNSLGSGPNRFTSIGGAVQRVLDEFAAAGDTDQSKHAVLILDGSQHSAGTPWSDVEAAARASGVIFHVIALGSTTDQPHVFQIARSTGGRYAYVPVSAVAPDRVTMAEELALIAAEISGRTGIAQHDFDFDQNELTIDLGVPPQTTGLILPAVQQIDPTSGPVVGETGTLTLIRPDGSEVNYPINDTFVKSWSIGGSADDPLPAGNWQIRVTPAAGVGGNLQLSVFAQRTVPLDAITSISRVAATPNPGLDSVMSVGDGYAINLTALDACGVEARCTAGLPGQPVVTRRAYGASSAFRLTPRSSEGGAAPTAGSDVPLEEVTFNYEPIRHSYSRAEFSPFGSPTGFADDGTTSGEGSYRIKTNIPWLYDGYTVNLFSSETFAVSSDIPVSDEDQDGLPTAYEEQHQCLDPAIADATLDQDRDEIASFFEYQNGSNPCDPDSDQGGETDGSELRAGRDPLLQSDDVLPGVAFIRFGHELTHVEQQRPVPENALVVEFANSPNFGDLVLKRGVVNGQTVVLSDYAQLDRRALGRYEDTRVTPGVEYCYQVEPFDMDDNAGRPSDVICAVAKTDAVLPWGELIINGGRPRTSNPSLILDIGLYNKAPGSSEMRIDVDGISSGWIPYANTYQITVAASDSRRTVSASLVLRDGEGSESSVYSDSIELWPAGSLGGIGGRFLLEGISAGSGLGYAGIFVDLDSDKEPPVYTAASGGFLLDDLVPGQYRVNAGRDGWADRRTDQLVTVAAGQVSELGQLVLAIGSERLFGDDFE